MDASQRLAIRMYMMTHANLVRDTITDEVNPFELAQIAEDQFKLEHEDVLDIAEDVAEALDRKRRR